jgi:hypothetical protein
MMECLYLMRIYENRDADKRARQKLKVTEDKAKILHEGMYNLFTKLVSGLK